MKCFPVLLISMMLVAASVGAQPVTTEQAGDVLATVGSHQITRDMLDHIISTIPEESRVPFLTPDGRKKILDEVVSFMLFAEAARKTGIDKEPAVKTRIQYQDDQYLAREYFQRLLAKAPQVSEEELQAYYKDHIMEFTPPDEIKARHILLKTEVEANKVLDEVKAGKDFAELAKKFSIDPAAAGGGKLESPDGREWLPRGSFEKSFEVVVFKIPKGQIGGPVKTQFGWHILKVEDHRQPEKPTYVAVRTLIKGKLQEQKNQQLHGQITEELKKTIPVTIK
jgi:peptidyl-prolyl cis-trans isomerase C